MWGERVLLLCPHSSPFSPNRADAILILRLIRQMNSAFEEGITELESALFPKNTQALWRAQHGTALIAITSQEVNTLLVSQFLKAISIALSETFKTNIFYNPKDLIMRPDDVVANLSQLAPNGQLMFVNVAFMRQLRKAADAALA
eukprot:TRINITY_DN4734_c0_g1_i2.p1 TRINITY_DN4734_c0_g1~~TRINITY_DN4734_c0_g1_i2.p1  ORF type:complete len:145 (-),score=23.13 TRINITY_DN4734_c0_g1_i2:102-536(-)